MEYEKFTLRLLICGIHRFGTTAGMWKTQDMLRLLESDTYPVHVETMQRGSFLVSEVVMRSPHSIEPWADRVVENC